MKNKTSTQKLLNKGFTLIELLIVVVIIGILATIALPQYQMAVGKARLSTLKDNARVIKNALDSYYLVNNAYTNNLSALDIELKGTYENQDSIHLRDGSHCYTTATVSRYVIYCTRSILGTLTEYGINNSGQRWCNVYSQKDDKANRLCRQETGKTGKELDDSKWTKYSY